MGWTDVVLLERDKLTSGTTWHAAGLMVTFGSTSETSTEFRKYTRDLYSRLEAETGQSTGFNPVGFIEIATDPDRLEEYRRVSAFNRFCGVDVHEISAREVADLFPLARVDDVLAGFYVAEDGRANPVDVTMALAKGARSSRARRSSRACRSPASRRRGGAVTGVTTPLRRPSRPSTSSTAPACGRASSAQTAGVNIPLQAAEHYYLITEEFAGISNVVPGARGPGQLRLLPRGGRRPDGRPVRAGLRAVERRRRSRTTFSFGEIPPDWDRMGPYLEAAMSADPDLERGRHPEVLLRPGELHRRPRSPSSARRPSCATTSWPRG